MRQPWPFIGLATPSQPTETDVLAAQLLELDRCCRRQGRPAPGEAGGAEGTAAQLARWEGRAVLVRPGRRRSPPPAAGMVLLGTGPKVAHKKTLPRKGGANANLSAKDMARMRVLKSVLQGQIAELVILTKMGIWILLRFPFLQIMKNNPMRGSCFLSIWEI